MSLSKSTLLIFSFALAMGASTLARIDRVVANDGWDTKLLDCTIVPPTEFPEIKVRNTTAHVIRQGREFFWSMKTGGTGSRFGKVPYDVQPGEYFYAYIGHDPVYPASGGFFNVPVHHRHKCELWLKSQHRVKGQSNPSSFTKSAFRNAKHDSTSSSMHTVALGLAKLSVLGTLPKRANSFSGRANQSSSDARSEKSSISKPLPRKPESQVSQTDGGSLNTRAAKLRISKPIPARAATKAMTR